MLFCTYSEVIVIDDKNNREEDGRELKVEWHNLNGLTC